MRTRRPSFLIPCVLGAALILAGCARKAAETPPAPPPAPPAAPPTAPPTPPPQETPPAPPPAPAPAAVELQDAFFDYDSYALRDDARSALDANAKTLRESAQMAVTVEGHCDERGTVEYNLSLGEKRANAARDYLVAAGISASRIETVSYGKERPFDNGHDEAAWAKNRRAHLVRK